MINSRGEVIYRTDLSYSGQVSHFTGKLEVPAEGEYWLEVLAAQTEERNFGRVVAEITVRPD